MLAGRAATTAETTGTQLSYPMYQDIRDKNQVFNGMFCTHRNEMSASFDGRTELISGELVSGNYFRVLGIGAAMGRVFTGSDDLYQGGHPLAVLSYGYWKSRFGGDRAILGKSRGQWLSAYGDRRQPGRFRRRGTRLCAADSHSDHHGERLPPGGTLTA